MKKRKRKQKLYETTCSCGCERTALLSARKIRTLMKQVEKEGKKR